MKRAISFLSEIQQVATIQELTSIFESIASIRISQTKDKVASSTIYFNELWQIYSQLRSDPDDRLTEQDKLGKKDKTVFVVIASQGGLSGDIDQRAITSMLRDFRPELHEIIVVGAHGGTLLKAKHVEAAKVFALPEAKDESPKVTPIIEEIRKYQRATCFYAHYVSLGKQEVLKMDLIQAVRLMSEDPESDQSETIDSRHYIFEPSLKEVTGYMESVMLEVAMSQFIFESELAQFASRFNAMSAAKQKAKDLRDDFNLLYHRAKRAESDNRLKEIINSLKVQ